MAEKVLLHRIIIVIVGSADISDACAKATQLASQEKVTVEFTFKEVILFAQPGDSTERIIHEYHLRRENTA